MKFLAFDLGAESGRAVLGTLDRDRIALDVFARFPNIPKLTDGHWHWDTRRFFEAMNDALRAALAKHPDLDTVGCDTWGVDYATLDHGGRLIGDPYCYRDSRTDGIMERAFARLPREEIYRETGCQFMPFNTCYQFLAATLGEGPAWKDVGGVLWMADYFHYLLSGKRIAEVSLASTSQFYDPARRAWSRKILDAFGAPLSVLPPLSPSGETLGGLAPALGFGAAGARVKVVAPCSHDTGCAFAAVPAEGDDWACISSGTWSLLGAELEKPCIHDAARDLGFTNEVGVDHTIRFLRNIIGLWLVQECRRAWEAEGRKYDYPTLARLAAEAAPFGPLVDPDDPRFVKPGEMPRKLADACRETDQPAPEGVGALVRCAYESLALEYRHVLGKLEKALGRRFAALHVVGGGSQNSLLGQLTADAIGRPVIAGPAEATALGNCLIQAKGLKAVKDRAHLRRIVRNSFELRRYEPKEAAKWDAHYARFLDLKRRAGRA
ncbi:MAG: rhamnulokinase [Verrucomicrobiae bacterium]|nr:rhamnulokinase [Verrucomicrobiae bacterium]